MKFSRYPRLSAAACCTLALGLASTNAGCEFSSAEEQMCANGHAWFGNYFSPAEDRREPLPVDEPTRNYLHTNGSQIVDHRGDVVTLRGVNWFGLETNTFALHGLDKRNLGSMLDQMVRLGFNVIRVPLSSEGLESNPPARDAAIDYGHNPQLVGLRYLEQLDALVDAARLRGLRIIFDRHRGFAAGTARCTIAGPWYDDTYTEERWISDWEMLAERYLGEPTVSGFDLHNEPGYDATWGSASPATDWNSAATRAGDAILAVNPELLIIVEGLARFNGEQTWHAGDLRAAFDHPVRLAIPNQLVYSVHEYATSVAVQPWFEDPKFPNNLRGRWDDLFGYLVADEIAPVLVGEFGTTLEDSRDQLWLGEWLEYLEIYDYSFIVWSWNPNSHDTAGLLEEDWYTVRANFYAQLLPLLDRPTEEP